MISSTPVSSIAQTTTKVTTINELTGSADHEPPGGGGACGTSPTDTGTEGTPCISANQNFPTTAKEKEKQKEADNKSKGIEKVVKKKPKTIERHYDDCGDNLKGLCEAYSHRVQWILLIL